MHACVHAYVCVCMCMYMCVTVCVYTTVFVFCAYTHVYMFVCMSVYCDRPILGSQDKSGMETVIEAPGDFLPYTSKMLPHLRLLGTALAISKFTESVVESPGDPDSKCISILSRWLDVTPNPTWKLFCERLQVTQVFNNLRETISKDKCL